MKQTTKSKTGGTVAEGWVKACAQARYCEGVADLVHVPLPVHVTGFDKRTRKVLGVFTQRLWSDYFGLLQGGRALVGESKETENVTSFGLSALRDVQLEKLDNGARLGAFCFVHVLRRNLSRVDFSTLGLHERQGVHYLLPWTYPGGAPFGGKSAKWEALEAWRVPSGRDLFDAFLDESGKEVWDLYCKGGWAAVPQPGEQAVKRDTLETLTETYRPATLAGVTNLTCNLRNKKPDVQLWTDQVTLLKAHTRNCVKTAVEVWDSPANLHLLLNERPDLLQEPTEKGESVGEAVRRLLEAELYERLWRLAEAELKAAWRRTHGEFLVY